MSHDPPLTWLFYIMCTVPNIKNYVNLKNEYNPKNEDDLKIKDEP